jgi:K+-sensing histidine kinase KdpD
MKSPLQILSLEDDAADADLILATLAQANIKCEAVQVETEPEFLDALEKCGFDLILSDHSLPTFDGLSALKIALGKAPDVPFIFVSGSMGEDLAIELIKSGATDYVLKNRLSRLAPAVRRAIAEAEERAARQEAERRLTILDRSKNEFLNLISHEFRTPLNGLLGVGEIVLDGIDSTAEGNELREMFEESRRRITSILDDALLLTQIDVSSERFRSAPVSLQAALHRAIERTTELAQSRHVTLTPPPTGSDLILGDEDLLVRALHALLETAVKFSEEGETVRLAREVVSDSLKVTIESRGKTIPSPALAKFFDLFSIGEASTPGRDLGLGPPVAYRILSLFGASVSVANGDPSGIRLTISIKHPAPNCGDSRTV